MRDPLHYLFVIACSIAWVADFNDMDIVYYHYECNCYDKSYCWWEILRAHSQLAGLYGIEHFNNNWVVEDFQREAFMEAIYGK